jgi:RepB plasmid partitioning protein/ParB-like nuclease family protein
MSGNSPKRPVRMAFEESTVRVAIADVLPLRVVRPELKSARKYAQIATSIRELGIIEPPVVARQRGAEGKYLLLDGHLRIEALKDMGETEVVCLLSTDDEAVTYNKRVSRIAIVQEHKMIMKAIERGVPEQRIAAALDIDIASLRVKVRLFNGICPEVIDMLKDKDIHVNAILILKKMLPLRQIEAVELMVAMNRFTASYAQSLLAATPQAELVEPSKPRRIKGLTEKQMLLMQRESAKLDRQFKLIEQTYGNDHLDLVLVNGYVAKLIANARIVKFLTQHYAEILTEFQRIVDVKSAAA